MSDSSTNPPDAELLELLAELADQEERVLLNASFTRARKNFYSDPERISARAPGLSSLERKLLEAFRGELAQLIKDACFRLLSESKLVGPTLYRYRGPENLQIEPRDADELRTRHTQLAAAKELVRDFSDPLGILERAIVCPASQSPTLVELASAGERLLPLEALRIYKARGLEILGDNERAAAILMDVYEKPIDHRNKFVAAECLGSLASREAEHHGSALWYDKANDLEPRDANSVFFLSFCSIQAGNWHLLHRADSLSKEMEPESSFQVELQEYLTRTRSNLQSRRWQPSCQSESIVSKVRSHADSIEKICDLFR